MSATKARTDAEHARDAAEQPQSAPAPSPFTPIADHAFLPDRHTGALIPPTERSTGRASRASTRRASTPARPSGRQPPPRPVRPQRAEPPGPRAGDQQRQASPLGLCAEEFDVDAGRHPGNVPQAFSHPIEAAARIVLAERLEEHG